MRSLMKVFGQFMFSSYLLGIDWTRAYEIVDKQEDAGDEITWVKPGEIEAFKMMNLFIDEK